ncbi:HSF-type DNA-binding protein [Nitzschia inconspicua]|uniref:HSF-type DNA-binding protein n=1 Tax=Nitzschia inconspicua TaxID=303405 RepID=A0A9K3KG99_9STRA|nr:HSF-type DNA-binding protein [Nitzschia inconspicua]KAG7371686.1 HSF-type DNA-binding protein [Nitzschia inconspicua]
MTVKEETKTDKNTNNSPTKQDTNLPPSADSGVAIDSESTNDTSFSGNANTLKQQNEVTMPPAAAAAAVVDTSDSNVAGSTMSTAKNSGGHSLQFPFKLHDMLQMAEETGKDHIVSWMPEGRGFKVHNKEAFCEHIMPVYFSSNKYKTFQRSLNLWGFESVSKGPNRGACYHESFVKGQPELCHSMNRVKVKGKGSRSDGNNTKQLRNGVTNSTIPQQMQQQQQKQQQGNIASFIRGNNSKNGMPDPQAAAALAMATAAVNPQLAMMNAAAAAGFFNPAMMGFHPAAAAAMFGMNPAMSAALFNPNMFQAAALQQQQQQQQQQQALAQLTTKTAMNSTTPAPSMLPPAASVPALPAFFTGGGNNTGRGEPTSTAEV